MIKLLKFAGIIIIILIVIGILSGNKNEPNPTDPQTGTDGSIGNIGSDAPANTPVETPQPRSENVEINLTRILGPARQKASGFLASISRNDPPNSLVAQIKPKLFRLNTQTWDAYSRVSSMSAATQIVPSYPDHKGPGKGDYESWYQTWESHLKNTLDATTARRETWQWDIWNEPNWPSFWNGTRAQYLETWKRSYRVIREKNPNATIVGPSAAYYDENFLHEFLQYAKSNNVLPDILTWHELVADSPKFIPSRVDAISKYMTNNGINISRIQLNEVTAMTHQFKPGHIIWFFAAIERTKIEAAAKSCWFDGFGHNCINNSMNGLLGQPGNKTRSAFWAYKAYADITGQIVEVKSSNQFDGVAGGNSGTLRAVIGNHDSSSKPLFIKINGLTGNSVRIKAYSIDNSERDEAGSPQMIIDKRYPVVSGSAQLNLGNIGGWDGVSLEVTN